LVFTRAWTGGHLVLDGQGQSLWVKLALDHWWGNAGVPYWIGEMWSGTPAWGLAPTFPVINLLPVAALIGPEEAVRAFGIAAQIIGAWGAFILARSLWENRAGALMAGFVYGLHPLLVSHLALFGHQTSIAVMAATPWLVLAVLAALRGQGRRWIALAGLLSGFCILEQAEHIYGLLLLIGCVFMTELASTAKAGGRAAASGLLRRATAVGGLAGGMAAYWLLPLSKLNTAFVLTPPELARYTLTSDVGARLGNDPGLYLRRTGGVGNIVTFNTLDVFNVGSFYLSWVCVLLTIVTIVAVARRRGNGTLSAILVASTLALWTSNGGVAFVSGSLAKQGPIPWLVVGALSGLLLGGFIRQLHLGRVGTGIGVVLAVLLFGLPYVAPFLAIQDFVPLLLNVRFPRLYPIAILGFALGAGYPVVLATEWASQHRPQHARVLAPAVALALIAAFLVDAAPYSGFYNVSPPDPTAGYTQAATRLAAAGDSFRVAGTIDPRVVEPLLDSGRDQATGWPHPVASQAIWHLTFESLFASPPGFRDGALGLSSTGYYVFDPSSDPIRGTGPNAPTKVDEVTLQRNPGALPLVRAYDSAVIVKDATLAPDLAVQLSRRGIGVITGDSQAARALGPVVRARVPAENACASPRAERPQGPQLDAILAREVASACSLNKWVGGIIELGTVGLSSGTGGVFTDHRGELRGISVWLDRTAGPTELILRELGPDGRLLGPVVARSRSTTLDENEMAYFPLEPDATSAGKRYVFLLNCVECAPGTEPRLAASAAIRREGDLVVNGEVRKNRVASFALVYDRVERVDPSVTSVAAKRTGPGRWSINSEGSRPSLVVVADAWFPGWEAHIDGEPVPAFKADGGFVGIPVAAGAHHITLSYEAPAIAIVGKVISTVAVLVAIALLLPAGWWPMSRRGRRRRRRVRNGARPNGAGGQPLVAS
jgi:hypothetical protein